MTNARVSRPSSSRLIGLVKRRRDVLPTGGDPDAKFNDPAKLRYNHAATIRVGIERAYSETSHYLDAL